MPHTSHLVQCPYFVHEKNRSISCEDTARTFTDVAEKEAWMDCYCDNKWCDCRYAMDLDIMYHRIEEGADMAEEKLKHITKATKKEHKTLAMRYDASDKRVNRLQKKLDELRAINQSLTNENIKLQQQSRKSYERWRKENERVDALEHKLHNELGVMADIYETRMAYLIDKYAPDKVLLEDDVKEWAGDRQIALVRDDEQQHCRSWRVMFREETAEDEDVSEPVSGAAEGQRTEDKK